MLLLRYVILKRFGEYTACFVHILFLHKPHIRIVTGLYLVFSLNRPSSRSFQITSYRVVSLLLNGADHSLAWMYHNLLDRPPIDSGCFQMF